MSSFQSVSKSVILLLSLEYIFKKFLVDLANCVLPCIRYKGPNIQLCISITRLMSKTYLAFNKIRKDGCQDKWLDDNASIIFNTYS